MRVYYVCPLEGDPTFFWNVEAAVDAACGRECPPLDPITGSKRPGDNIDERKARRLLEAGERKVWHCGCYECAPVLAGSLEVPEGTERVYSLASTASHMHFYHSREAMLEMVRRMYSRTRISWIESADGVFPYTGADLEVVPFERGEHIITPESGDSVHAGSYKLEPMF